MKDKERLVQVLEPAQCSNCKLREEVCSKYEFFEIAKDICEHYIRGRTCLNKTIKNHSQQKIN